MMCEIDSDSQGYIFNIQHYSLHDGGGIRTIVFLKGCPLRCTWCSNPESQQFYPQISFNKSKCIGIEHCSSCLHVCKNNAVRITDDKIEIDRNNCNNCMACSKACPSKAFKSCGEIISANDLLDIVEKDSVFYARSGGGLTLSGGEPLAQGNFALNILKSANKRYINTAIETCGYVPWDILEQAAEYLDTILYDIKCIDDEKHISYTGVSNKVILSNFNKLCEQFPDTEIIVRTPVIPTFNDTKDEIDEILAYIKDKPNIKYEFLPYHAFGSQKYKFLGVEYPLGDVRLGDDILAYLHGLNAIHTNINLIR